MGIRKIPINSRSVTCRFFSVKNWRLIECESTVERDFYLWKEFDLTVHLYEEQPVAIPARKGPWCYYPDTLVTYWPQEALRQRLVEIKMKADMEDPKKAKLFEEKCSVVRKYAADKGLDFEVVFDTDFRGQLLENYRFIYGYWEAPSRLPDHKERILSILKIEGTISVHSLLSKLSPAKDDWLYLLPSIWHLLFKGGLTADLSQPLTNSTIIEVTHADPSR